MALTRPFIRPLPFSFQRPLDVKRTSNSYALDVERSAIEANGGVSNRVLNGHDGHTRGIISHPMEVKEVEKDSRFRIGRKNHEDLLQNNGIYLFINERGQQVRMSAIQADSLVRYKWMQDVRKNGVSYEHGFIFKSDVFR